MGAYFYRVNPKGNVYYSDYLALNDILNAQHPESTALGLRADDEMLFIVIHQAYELWFKQILFEAGLVHDIFSKPVINDNDPDLYNALHRLQRVVTILKLLVQQIDVMETMTPLDFLDFRNLLRPASGFQSIQFKILEATLGLKFDERHGHNYYLTALRPEDVEKVKAAEQKTSLINLIQNWLERLPIFEGDTSYQNSFWQQYRHIYNNSLQAEEKHNLEHFDNRFMDRETQSHHNVSNLAARHALFIILYRDYPLLQIPYGIINTLLEIDEQMALWRFRHMSMVQRIIGARMGTGGSTGRDYLKGALDKHYIFKDFAELTSFLIERRFLPELPATATHYLQFKLQQS